MNNLEKHKKSFDILDKAEKMNGDKSQVFKMQIYTEYAKNFTALGLYNKSILYFDKAIAIAEKEKIYSQNPEDLSYMYGCKASAFQELNKHDSLYASLITAKNIKVNSLLCSRIARYHVLYTKRYDSAIIYLKKAELLNNNKNNFYYKSIMFRIYGLYYYKTGHLKKSIEYYKKSIDISKKHNRVTDESITIDLLYDSYKAIGDKENQLKLLEEYNELRAKIDLQNKNEYLDLLERSGTNEIKENVQNSNLVLILIVFGILIIVVAIAWYFSYKNLIRRILNKRILITEREKQNLELETKLKGSTEELYTLAKNNDALFFTKFQEIYPHFSKKLLEINPSLALSEIQFCALLTFNFTSKEIAQFTFTAPKTVENKKTRIRKRLNIPVEINLSLALRKFLYLF